MISECCGAEDRLIKDGSNTFSNIGYCPECIERCNFISEEEFGNEYAKEIDALTGDE